MSCKPTDITIDLPSGPSGPVIPGFGVPFSLDIPNINPFPDGFPEDLLDLMNKLQMLIPPGILKPALNPNFGKDIFDAIMKLLDQFLPFLMLYKFFLPLLKLVLCILEIICSLNNPVKLRRAIKRMFRNCIPDFLNLFPIFAIIMMIIQLLLLLLALIEYIIAQILKLIQLILRNIIALNNAIKNKNDNSVLAIAKKIGSLLCMFQNLFVLLSLISIIIQIFRDILSLAFAIPPCEKKKSSDVDGCCTPDVCPEIVNTQVHRFTGEFKYIRSAQVQPSVYYTVNTRQESWQLYDLLQTVPEQFRNIFDAYDVDTTPKPVFFPTDVTYSKTTPVTQAAYTVDLKLFYNPINWSRTGDPRWIIFKDCIMLSSPIEYLINYDNTYANTYVHNGVVRLVGGQGYESNGITKLTGYAADGITPISDQATLENFIHKPVVTQTDSNFYDDGYFATNVEYTLKPNLDVLFSKGLITSGCLPDIDEERTFVNEVLVGPINVTLAEVNDLLKEENGFPSPSNAQQCLTTALAGFRNNLTVLGAATFQATSVTCLNKLKSDTERALGNLVGLGFDPCKSTFTVTPPIQFTSRTIEVKVNLNERNGTSITSNLSTAVAENIAARIKSHMTVGKGKITNFTYDGYQIFTALISSDTAVDGRISITFDDQALCTNTMPTNVDETATHAVQILPYKFIYTPGALGGTSAPSSTGEIVSVGDDTRQPRRNQTDIAGSGSGKDVR